MADRPILFSGPMVRALLAGTKTQTRRALKPQPEANSNGWWHIFNRHGGVAGVADKDVGRWAVDYLPIAVGDRLWVRESGYLLREAFDHDPRSGDDVYRDAGFLHSVDGSIVQARTYDVPLSDWVDDCSRHNRPSIHMPRWASRITLTVTDVRVERLQDISEEDAIAEGIEATGRSDENRWRDYSGASQGFLFAANSYRSLWGSINGVESWGTDPWVAAYTFTVHHGNIDALGAHP